MELRRPKSAVGGARTFPPLRDDVDHYWTVHKDMRARARTDDGKHYEWHGVT